MIRKSTVAILAAMLLLGGARPGRVLFKSQ